MVFVRVCQNKTQQIFFNFGHERHIGHNNFYARQIFAGKPDAAIEHDPFPLVGVQVQVHANLIRTAKRHEEQFIAVFLEIEGHFLLTPAQAGVSCWLMEFRLMPYFMAKYNVIPR